MTFRWIVFIGFFLSGHFIQSQVLLKYDADHTTAKVHYNDLLYATYKNHYNRLPSYPIVGPYGSTAYSVKGVGHSEGQCNYIYLPYDDLEVGKQYSVNLTIEMDKDYADMPYFQKGFGFAIASYLFKNKWGLWPKQFVPFGVLETKIPVEVDFEFRPMSKAKYLIIGGFPTPGMDDYLSNLSQHEFRIYDFKLSKSDNPNVPFHYVGDAFAEEKLKQIFPPPLECDTILFDSGSALIKSNYAEHLKAIHEDLITKQDLVHILAYTDSKGSDNEKLGQDRGKAVKSELIKAGLDSNRIVVVNFGESQASDEIKQLDRRVEVYPNFGKLYQKYYTQALRAAESGDYATAHKQMHSQWIKRVPPDLAMTSLFDCWGEDHKAHRFKKELTKAIKKKYYRGKSLAYDLDSLYFDSKKGKDLKGYLRQNLLPLEKCNCRYNFDWAREKRNQDFADALYNKSCFPSKSEVGKRANKVLPNIIISSDDVNYLKKYLPLFREACEKGLLSWRYYARLYDRINVMRTGFQRYGTITYVSEEGRYLADVPIEDLNALEEYRRQVKLVTLSDKQMEELKEDHNSLDTAVVRKLNEILQADQASRYKLKELQGQYGFESKEVVEQWKLIDKVDSLNQIDIENLITDRGWLSAKDVGIKGSSTLFIVIQHADLETQQQYLPMMRTAVKEGKAKGYDLALLEDRVAIALGQKQIYGSQVQRDEETGDYSVSPIQDPINVDKRRQSVGLGPLAPYLKRWNIDWNPKPILK